MFLQPTVWNYAHPDKVACLQELLERNPGKWDISSLRVIECVSDILRPEIHKHLQEKLGVAIYHEYGSTEAGVPFQIDFRAPPVPGSVGKPRRKVKVRLLKRDKFGRSLSLPVRFHLAWPSLAEPGGTRELNLTKFT